VPHRRLQSCVQPVDAVGRLALGCVGSTDCAITRHCSLASSSALSRHGRGQSKARVCVSERNKVSLSSSSRRRPMKESAKALHRLARRDVVPRNFMIVGPSQDRVRGQLGAVVTDDRLGHAVLIKQPIKLAGDPDDSLVQGWGAVQASELNTSSRTTSLGAAQWLPLPSDGDE
jgi:hypothetical protein